ncbi:HAMP domain-containing protein [Fortiea sp. LEGE XX443]|uniref:sensor histidine kinase n=1 Tax=Fortiea sp. LEGE XX443 TaxID=1828611 RepID=UPI001882F4B2|nr:ATP-binding protein [Fortiea sp. LEGE XX443]MBE9007435.1 HAMP domain-containing protein [Fortiea sp. LEGE XX443]
MLKIRLGVGQRISLGYAIALGIAVSGTVAGFGIGRYHYRQASVREDHTRNEVELLHRLQTSILQARTHQQQLIPLMQHPQKSQEEYTHLLHHKVQIELSWAELQEFLKNQPQQLKEVHNKEIPGFVQTYTDVPQQYFQELERQMQRIQSLNLAVPKDIEQGQKMLLLFTNSELALKYDGISDDLVEIIKQSYKEARKAKELFQQSSNIAQDIVINSITFSVVISIVLTTLTTRAIANPIQILTNVARRSTEESNFELQVPIERDDEIGILAKSFNQLIAAVQQLLQQQQTTNQQLAAYSETLEQKVEQRTEELNEKNSHLENILEELQRTQFQMVQSEKMSALGQMIAGVAHEINNPVNFIHGNLSYVQEYAENLLNFVKLYQKYYPEPIPEIADEAEEIDLEFMQADLPKMLDSMKVGTDRIRQIVLSLRNFSRTDEAGFKAVDIHEGIDSTLLILQHRLKEQPERPAIAVIKDYDNLPLVECYPGQINQVLMNILANGIDAIEESIITSQQSKVEYLTCHRPQIIIRTSVVNSQWIEIAIADNGSGIPEAVQKQIFHPFFTTKPIGKGTGMGMSISYQIITEKHGGKLECLSTPGQGAEFVIQIPISQNSKTQTALIE